MTTALDRLAVMAKPEDTIDRVVRRMADESHDVAHAGLAVVLDPEGVVVGVVTDGDIRRAYAKDIPFSQPVSTMMVREFIHIPAGTPAEEIAPEVLKRVRLAGRRKASGIRHVLLMDDSGRLANIVDFFEALQDRMGSTKKVAVFGMGYVGLTLAVSLANRGHLVTGVEINPDTLRQLAQGIPHVHEPGLTDMLRVNLDRQQITFAAGLSEEPHQVYIVAVGTPLGAAHQPDLGALQRVLGVIAGLLKQGDQVMLRSTVPVGTTREVVIPFLEERTGLHAGEDFYVCFSPERTVEGRAMQELRTLPQVIGGYSPRCLRRAAEFWATLTPSVVQVASLEAAEAVKLANNTYRDLSFAFANEVALLADAHNLDAFHLISAANEGYPRNPIPLPSPGVGGYCLTKDPILFSSTPHGPREDAVLGPAGRQINERAAHYPVDVLERHAAEVGLPLAEMKVVIVGLAFKGEPETTDMRGSTAVSVLNALRGRVRSIVGWDAVIAPEDVKEAGFETTADLAGSIEEADAVLILNNHPDNMRSEISVASSGHRLIFDGWHQFEAAEIEKIPGLRYATMGYMSPRGTLA